ncbi:MAG: N-6 DNA methylase [Candidatus Asgardarchaeia archaeon]
MLENSIWGFDALEHAAQTASIVLSLHEPGVPLAKMNVYHVPVDEKGSLGSLNLWWANTQLLPIKRRSISEVVEETVTVPKFDLIIMNPPFSRTTAPGEKGSRPRIFDFVTDAKTFKRLWKEYKRLIKNVEESIKMVNYDNNRFKEFYEQYVKQEKVFRPQDINPLNAGASLPFVFLADRYLRDGGRLALVLPKTVLENAAFFFLRNMLLTKYIIEYIVMSSEGGNPNFSYSTDFSEILLVAKKSKEKNPEKQRIFVINFKSQPKNVLDGILIAKEVINQKLKIDRRRIIKTLFSEAEVFPVSRKALEDFVWNFSMLIDLPPTLREIINKIPEGILLSLKVPIYKILNLSNVNVGIKVVNPRTFRGNKLDRYFSLSSGGKYKVLKKAGKEVMSSLSLDLIKTENIVPNSGEAEEVYRKNSGRLIIPEVLGFNTLVATWSNEPIISSVAFVINVWHQKVEPQKVERALCVWLNSTPIITYLRALFTTLAGKFGHVRGWYIRVLPVPDLSNLNVVNNLIKVFNKYASVKWEPLPNQYEKVLSGTDTTRLKYDLDVLKALADSYNLSIKKASLTNMLLDVYRELLEII